MADIICPHCNATQSDCHNGGDPGDWWGDQYMPDGDCEVECDSCDKPFIVVVSWTPSFEGKMPEED